MGTTAFYFECVVEFRDHSASRSITIQYVQIVCSLPLKNSLCLSVCHNSQVKLDLFCLSVRQTELPVYCVLLNRVSVWRKFELMPYTSIAVTANSWFLRRVTNLLWLSQLHFIKMTVWNKGLQLPWSKLSYGWVSCNGILVCSVCTSILLAALNVLSKHGRHYFLQLILPTMKNIICCFL